jgi:hypothetical protein
MPDREYNREGSREYSKRGWGSQFWAMEHKMYILRIRLRLKR